MNKLIIFDLDGVLIDSRDLHYIALNVALNKLDPKFVITQDEHLSLYDGLSTSKKLSLLSVNKGLPSEHFNQIWLDKQAATFSLLTSFTEDVKLIDIFSKLSKDGIKIAVASNSIRKTLQLSLLKIGILKYVDYFVSNEDVSKPKPYPEMYWKCMIALNAIPSTTVIIEDSHIGRQAALDSGAMLLPVNNPDSLTKEVVNTAVNMLNNTHTYQVPWKDKNLNVLIPMAGAGSRFFQSGYTFPKPLIEVNGKPMIQVVVENLNIEANYIFLVQKEHYEKYNLKHLLNLIAPNCTIVQVDGLTDGAACTTLLAEQFINSDCPLVIANSDQFVVWNSNQCLYSFTADQIDGGIVTFESMHPKWSFAKLASDGFVCEVAEKSPISNNATVGIYYWKHGKDYVRYAKQMIEKNIRTNNEFYVCPVFNEAIQDNKKIKVNQVTQMWGIGTPEDLTYFLNHYKNETNSTPRTD